MCGIFGVVASEQSHFLNATLERAITNLFKYSESRGKEASGLLSIFGEKINLCKAAIPASDMIRTSQYQSILHPQNGQSPNGSPNAPLAVIGHSRLVTTGLQIVSNNNQPVINNGVVGVHNGIIVNFESLWEQYPSLSRHSDVDSEVIAALLRMFYSQYGSIPKATQHTFGLLDGTASVAFLFKDLDEVLLATNNGSLYLCKSNTEKTVIFSSERYILQRLMKQYRLRSLLGEYEIVPVLPGQGYLLGLQNATLRKFPLSGNIPADVQGQCATQPREIHELFFPKQKETIPQYNFTPISQDVLSKFEEEFQERESAIKSLQRCRCCILPETMPGISFNEDGVCCHCQVYRYEPLAGREALEKLIAPYRKSGGKPDCILMFSGGRDSSYGLHYIKKVLGLNPVTFTYDWGMVTDLARRNISRMCSRLGVENILVSADITMKRDYIRRNVEAWLKRPNMGMVPLFMAGDKHFFYYANNVRKQVGVDLVFYCTNRRLEKTLFKSGFCEVPERGSDAGTYYVSLRKKLALVKFYLLQVMLNPRYINKSLADTLFGFYSAYLHEHNMVRLYEYILWDEQIIENTLLTEYDWETDAGTSSTWRIGDGTAAFYNYIYYMGAGFSEIDTYFSNMIREGIISRKEALGTVFKQNQPRFESIKWYCDTIGIDFGETIKTINAAPKLYSVE